MNKIKGFTLFTALVGFIIIGFGILIISHMSNSEKNYNQIIVSIRAQSEMESIKDIIRLEGFHIFNLILRTRLYDYYNVSCGRDLSTCGTYELRALDYDLEKSIDELKLDHQKNLFNVEESREQGRILSFADFIGSQIPFQLSGIQGWFRNIYFYRVYDRESLEVTTNNGGQELTDLSNDTKTTGVGGYRIAKATSDALISQSDIVKEVNCNNNDCADGSYYIIANFADITESDYLGLPRIFVSRNVPRSTLDDSILPRARVTFYVPFRIMGAVNLFKNNYTLNKSDIISTLKEEKIGTILTNGSVMDECPHEYSTEVTSRTQENYNISDEFKLMEQRLCSEIKTYSNDLNVVDCIIEPFIRPYKNIKLNGISNSGSVDHIVQRISHANLYVVIKDQKEDFGFSDSQINYALRYNVRINEDIAETENVDCTCTFNQSSEGGLYTCVEG